MLVVPFRIGIVHTGQPAAWLSNEEGNKMFGEHKVWVIDPKRATADSVRDALRGTAERPGNSGAGGPAGSGDAGTGTGGRGGGEQKKKGALPVLLSYLLGPFAVLVTRSGRQSRFWVSVALGSVAAFNISYWRLKIFYPPLEHGGIASVVLFWIVCLAALAGFAAWARGVILIGRHKGWLLKQLPAWLRQPLAAGALGFLVPGLGLLVTGHAKRAACALWTAGASLVSILVISQAAALWRWNLKAGSLAVPGDRLELAFLAAGAVGFIGALVWIVQALDGARLAGDGSEGRGGARGDLYAIALLAVVVIMSAAFEGEFAARPLGRLAVSARLEGMRIIPLCMSLAAVHLDPSRPEYMMHAAGLYDDLGRRGAADAIREELRASWRPYVELLRPSYPDMARSSDRGGRRFPEGVTGAGAYGRIGYWERIKSLYGTTEDLY